MVRTKFVARGVGVAALELVLVGEGDGVDEEIERAPLLPRASSNDASTEAASSTSQGSTSLRADRLRQRLDPPAERLALIGEGERGAVSGERPRNAPGDRVVVGDPHDQPALALHQSRHVTRQPRRYLITTVAPAGIRVFGQLRPNPHASSRLNTTDALVPPKPNEFDSTQPSFTSSRRSRTIGMSAKAGSRFSILALSQMKPLFIISSE